MPLTTLAIQSFPFDDGQRDYPDSAVQGLALRCGKTTKTFMLTIRKPRRKRIALGHFPALSLANAREKARDLLAQARLAKDEPPTIRFEEALRTFYKVHLQTMRPTSRPECQRQLNTHFLPKLKDKALADIKTKDIAPLLDALIDRPGTHRNAYIYLRSFFNWCYQRGYIDVSPISRIPAPEASQPRERVLEDCEIVSIWHNAPDTDYGLVVKLCILSGQRIGRWSRFKDEWADFDKMLITWPPEAMKADRTHVFPMTEQVADLIKRRSNHSRWGMPDSGSKRRLDKASGVVKWTHHEIREWEANVKATIQVGDEDVASSHEETTGTFFKKTETKTETYHTYFVLTLVELTEEERAILVRFDLGEEVLDSIPKWTEQQVLNIVRDIDPGKLKGDVLDSMNRNTEEQRQKYRAERDEIAIADLLAQPYRREFAKPRQAAEFVWRWLIPLSQGDLNMVICHG